jgi:hypothetical protein
MTRNIITVFSLVVLMSSCGVTKEARNQQNLISGTWTLTDVRYENNPGLFKATIFNDADAICFEDSNWFFRDNNSTGRYTLKSGSLCSGGDRFIRWSVQKNPSDYSSVLQFKFIDENRKDISGGLGYRLPIETLTATNMVLKSNVMTDGKPVTVVLEFVKN